MIVLKRTPGVLSLALLLLMTAACGGGEEPTPTIAPSPEATQPAQDLQPIVASSDLSVGSNRVVFAVLDSTSNTVKTQTVGVATFFLGGRGQAILFQRTSAQFREWPIGGGVYTTRLSFDQAGEWGLEVAIPGDDGVTRRGRASFQVKRLSATPAIGTSAPPSKNKTSSDVDGLEELTSDPSPDPDLYTITIDQAINEEAPLLVSFSTPAFCQTFTCGLQLETIKGLKERYAEQISFIHVEVYDNPHEIQGDLTKL